MTEQEVEFLKRLEREELISEGTVRKIEIAIESADFLGKSRTRFIVSFCCAILGCALMSLGAWSPIHWLSVFCFSTMVLAFFISFFFFVGATDGDK